MEANPLLQKYGRTFQPGELIFEEDDEGDHMFIIQDGQVTISRTIAGKDTPVALLEKGEFFGEMAIVNRIRRTARARAHAPTQLLAFDRAGLEQLVEKNPKIALNIIDKLCRRLGSANAQIRQMAQRTSQHSLWVALQVLAQRDEGLGTLHQIQEELGMTLQCPQDEVNALVNQLVGQGALRLDGDKVKVGDRALFQKLAEAT
jgi:CRP-like cAMP-binding protein